MILPVGRGVGGEFTRRWVNSRGMSSSEDKLGLGAGVTMGWIGSQSFLLEASLPGKKDFK